jgi:hypothetical protein
LSLIEAAKTGAEANGTHVIERAAVMAANLHKPMVPPYVNPPLQMFGWV